MLTASQPFISWVDDSFNQEQNNFKMTKYKIADEEDPNDLQVIFNWRMPVDN